MILLKIIAYAFIPLVMAAVGTHMAADSIENKRKKRWFIAIFWAMAVAGVIISYIVERNSDSQHEKEVNTLNQSLDQVNKELKNTKETLQVTEVRNAGEMGILEGRVQDLALLLRQGNPDLTKFAESVAQNTKTLAAIQSQTVRQHQQSIGSKYSELSNSDLRKIVLAFVTRLRARTQQAQAAFASPNTALSAEQNNRRIRAALMEFMYDYNSRFKSDAILLRDEMLSRIHQPLTSREPSTDREYEIFNGNTYLAEEIATDLEVLANYLPTESK
jgi:hypothetical protein